MIVAIVQARMGSTRLPGKVLATVGESRTILGLLLERLARSERLDRVVVATTDDPGDDPVEALVRHAGGHVFRGSRDDVLDRYWRAARAHEADAVVRITADCPFMDPAIVDAVVDRWEGSQRRLDYVANRFPVNRWPDGTGVELIGAAALERTWREAVTDPEREHVTQYIRKHPELFEMGTIERRDDRSALRLTVDHPCDLDLIRAIWSRLFPDHGSHFGLERVLEVLDREPELAALNAHISPSEGLVRSEEAWARRSHEKGTS